MPVSSYFHWTMASIRWVLLLCLAQLHTLCATSNTHHADSGNLTHLPFLCHPDQAKVLLQLKKSFSFHESTWLSSWQDGTDCCFWEGVGCDAASGNVTVLDLNNRGLSSNGLDPAVFSLTSLHHLDLSMNDFTGAQDEDIPLDNIPATGFERLASLTHLNLSNMGLCGRIPIGIGKLVNLVSLDLSSSFEDDDDDYDTSDSYYVVTSNSLWEPNFDNLVANLSNLRELYLDGVGLSSSGEEWCTSLATHVPRLQVLSLASCSLRGPIHKSLVQLRSLVVINLQGNDDIAAAPFPEFFMNFLNLTVLQLSGINLEGCFPIKPFQSKTLRVVDLSNNLDLSGHLPNFSYPNSLETLRLDRTNFSYARPMASNNFKSLKHLSIGGNLSVDFLSSFGRLRSLCRLDLTLDSVNELGSIISLIGQQKNLMSLNLALYGCNFSEITPTLVSNFKNLRSLKMVDCNLPRAVFCAIGNFVDLQTLEMDSCTTYGSMPSSIGNLTNLKQMGIIDSVFSGPMPTAISKLKNLKIMWIIDCWFSGPIPSAIGGLTNLRNMHINNCGFSGPIPDAIGNLTNLKSMHILGYNSLSLAPWPIGHQNFGSLIPYAIGQLSELEWLVLQGCKFYGSIPSSIANLTGLTLLDLSFNSLQGEIPPSIFSLPALTDLDLSYNQLSGPIYGFDKATSRFVKVRLRNNALSGFIPEGFFELTSLVHIDVRSNKLIGSVNLSHFWRLSELTSLYLSYNELHVMASDDNNPVDTNYLDGLYELGLASCNITQFPRFLRHANRISYLDLSCNKISGDIPNWVWETTSWNVRGSYLNLSHNMFTGMQLNSDIIPFITPVQVLDLSFNRLSGRIPMPKSSGQVLEYSNNMFSSLLPNWTSYLWDTIYLSMSKNNINGHVPLSICNATQLDVLDLSYNYFNGLIPPCLVENVPLSVLNLRENRFEGMLPSNITRCPLQTIDLHGNKIEGQLPRGLSNCTYLEIIDFGSNKIADTFPSWLRGLPKLSVLVLRSNQLYGTIGDIVGDTKSEECFHNLQIIDLASNNFSGNMRPQWFKWLKSMMAEFNSSGKIVTAQNISLSGGFYQDFTEITYKGSDVRFDTILTTLTAIDFSNNRLEGNIPESIGRLVSLRVLNLSHNAFTGKIPAQLGGMTALESLDLSCNQLSGEIPQELTDLTFLDVLNLSENNLVGKIPQSHQFFTFDNNSFEGNAGLCGPPLSKLPCGASPYTPGVAQVDKPFHHVDVVLFLFAGLGFGVGFAAVIVVKWYWFGRCFIATVRALQS